MLQQGARYHVSARVNNKEFLIHNDSMKLLFEEILFRAKTKFSFSIENFVLMGNHFHLIIRPGKNENLSRIMQWILSVFAMAYNRRHGRSGHFWGNRFFSTMLDTLQQLIKTFEYIDLNPVNACLVNNVWEWHFGGIFHHRSGKRHLVTKLPDWITIIISTHFQLLLDSPLK